MESWCGGAWPASGGLDAAGNLIEAFFISCLY